MEEKNESTSTQRDIGRIEGKLESLATKADLAALKLDVSNAINAQTKELRDEIQGVKSRQTKMIGVAVGIGFILSLILGILNVASELPTSSDRFRSNRLDYRRTSSTIAAAPSCPCALSLNVKVDRS